MGGVGPALEGDRQWLRPLTQRRGQRGQRRLHFLQRQGVESGPVDAHAASKACRGEGGKQIRQWRWRSPLDLRWRNNGAATVLLRCCYGSAPMWIAQLTDIGPLARIIRGLFGEATICVIPSP